MKYEPSPRHIDCGGISADVNYVDAFTRADDPMHDGAHIHSFCEVYLNLSGDVSFVVEDSVYPVGRGDIIITKPNEVHRCVYHSDCVHEHFCLWLLPDGSRRGLPDCFFDRKSGEANLISMDHADREAVISAFFRLRGEAAREGEITVGYLAALYGILDTIDRHRHDTLPSAAVPEDLRRILAYIGENYNRPCGTDELSARFFISRSTLGRRFRDHLGTTPSVYVESKRLAAAKELLSAGESVQNTCALCGFSDYSHFIMRFREKFGTTPHRYSKGLSRRGGGDGG